jgi:hypothetical protein
VVEPEVALVTLNMDACTRRGALVATAAIIAATVARKRFFFMLVLLSMATL